MEKIPLPFEVGKTYKTKNGLDRTVVAICPENPPGYQLWTIGKLHSDGEYAFPYYIDGVFDRTAVGRDYLDLIPEYREPVVETFLAEVFVSAAGNLCVRPAQDWKLPHEKSRGFIEITTTDGVLTSVEIT